MRANLRLLTAVVIIGICGFSVARGLAVAHFSLALARIDSSEKRAEVVDRWSAAPDVASRALQADLAYHIDPSDQKAANHCIGFDQANVVVRLALALGFTITDQPMEQVFDSLELSMLTGPNEGHVMGERAVFAVSLRDRLPADLKRHAAVDVAFPRTPEEGAEIGKFQAVLATEPEWVRNELREAIVATGVSPKQIEKHLGF